jgi:hypothetical protein
MDILRMLSAYFATKTYSDCQGDEKTLWWWFKEKADETRNNRR